MSQPIQIKTIFSSDPKNFIYLPNAEVIMKVAVFRVSQGPWLQEQSTTMGGKTCWVTWTTEQHIFIRTTEQFAEVHAIPDFSYEVNMISWTQLPAWSASLELSLQIRHLQSWFEWQLNQLICTVPSTSLPNHRQF